jgi:protein O-GlcNAc transferase
MQPKTQAVTIPQAIEIALERHQTGRLPEAERIYQQVLQVEPNNPDALHLLGILSSQLGKYDTAVQLIEKAILHCPPNPGFLSNLGEANRRLGRLDDALDSYDKALAIKPDLVEVLSNRANVLKELKRYEEALASYDKALAIKPDFAEILFNRGVALHELRRYDEALASYDKALMVKPGYVEVLSNRGITLEEMKRHEDAIASYDLALTIRPDYFEALGNKGSALQKLHRYDEAIASYDRALAIKPDYAEALSNRGLALKELKRCDEALASLDRALEIKPDFAEAFSDRGLVLRELQRMDEALASFDKALTIKPDYAQALNNRGLVLKELQRYDEAMTSFDRALWLNPDYVDALGNRANALHQLKRYDEALADYDKALMMKPDFVEALSNRGTTLYEMGRFDAAEASYRRALELKADYPHARWALTMCQVPIIANSQSDAKSRRTAFAQMLAELDDWFGPEHIGEGAEVVGSLQPFYLAYQAENNRDLLSRYGALCSRLMRHWQESQAFKVNQSTYANNPGGVIRIGIASAYFSDHSVWNALVKGWIRQLDRRRFELHLFHLGAVRDQETDFARSIATRFVQGGRSLRGWVECVLATPLDVLMYPEIGMDPLTVKLASMRLAPVQLATWGHPETTGLPTIDYFISAEHLEPDNAQDHYTERLVKLPNLGCRFQSAPVTGGSVDFTKLGINSNSTPLLLCPGTPYKYAPAYDRILTAIAKELRHCQFIFFSNRRDMAEQLQRRLRNSFTEAGLVYEEYVVSIPWQEKADFYDLMRRADIYLDTTVFSGFNTAMQAVECALPIVTSEGRFLRGRLASGILKRMGLSELVAASEGDYIALAVRICQDARYRQHIRQRIEENRHILFDDIEPVKALEEFLVRAATSPGS